MGWCGGELEPLDSLNTVYSYINSDKIKDSIKKWSRVGWAASPSPWAKPGGGMVTGGRQPGSRGRNGHGWAQPGSLGRNGHGWAPARQAGGGMVTGGRSPAAWAGMVTGGRQPGRPGGGMVTGGRSPAAWAGMVTGGLGGEPLRS